MQSRRRNLFILLLVVGLLAASLAVIAAKPTRLGLDLKGGIELVYQAKPTPQQPTVTPEAVDRSLEIMRERVDALGVSEPEIQRSGSDQISVGLPDVQNAQRAISQVGKVAQLFFYDWEANVVGPDGKTDPTNPEVTGGPSAGQAGAIPLYDAVLRAAKRPPKESSTNTSGAQYYLVDKAQRKVLAGPEDTEIGLTDAVGGTLPAGSEVVKINRGTTIVQAEQNPGAVKTAPLYFVLNDTPALSGTEVENPKQGFNNGTAGSGAPNVTFEFSDKGQKAWQIVTREIAQRGQSQQVPGASPRDSFQHFAAVLDGKLITVPFIDYTQNPDGIDGRTGASIEGGFTITTAQDLAKLLQIGALPVKLELISQSQVSATLGQQALDSGLVAGAAGFLIVALFLLIFYRVLGIIAVVALAIYAIYFFALIKLIPITMTLPGIAGLILTIGVAADANIVVFERIKEEARAGASIPRAISVGYKKGFTAIIDANVVTLMTAFILFILATAGVKGFAFTLGIGVIVSMFTAVVATQAILGTMGSTRVLASRSALGAAKKRKPITFDFMGASRWFFSMSGVILLIGALAIGGKGLNFGIDFESGTRIRTTLTTPTNEDGVRAVMSAAGYNDAKIQRITENGNNNTFQISTATLQPTKVQSVRDDLNKKFGVGEDFSNTSVGPTFGQTVARSALIAIIASLVVISLYIAIRFEWKYAVPVLIALMHDLLITAGVYSLTGRELTTSTVAALLTILGYSLYDTIIVFDRIRENVPRMPRAAFTQIVNRSMSEVIVRSLATSFSTGLPILALLIFGGPTLQDFAFALLVGTISGTYSSIFIASPVLSHWKGREAIYKQRTERIKSENNGIVPAYAVATAGAPVDVAPPEAKARSTRRLTTPDSPDQVSRAEFDEMVADLGDRPAANQPSPMPAPKQALPPTPTTTGSASDDQLDASAQDNVDAAGKSAKNKTTRNRRHGRNR
ncbi:MAG: protein translocase subunit SecD [Actinomycetota bacterium]